ncbi:NucA/NucB deoxyribonuclease domain-containing protein, partial [Streptomyces glomeratus]
MIARKRRLRGFAAACALAAMALSSMPAAVAQSAPGTDSRLVQTSATGADTSEVVTPVSSLDAAKKESRLRQRPDGDAAKVAPSPAARKLPAVDFATAERRNRQTAMEYHQTSDGGAVSPQAAPPPIGDTPDPKLLQECFKADGATSDFGRVHNRFTYCNERHARVNFYWKVRGQKIWRGTNTFTYQIFAQGDETSRRIRVFSRVKAGTMRYDWAFPWDQWTTGPDTRLNLMANCPDSFTMCHAAPSSVSMPFIAWDHNTKWFNWDVFGHKGAGLGRDKITLSRFQMDFWPDWSNPAEVDAGASTPRWMRCDSANYFRRGSKKLPEACVFNEVTPRLTYRTDAGSDHRSVAFHIYTAQYHPNQTYPLLVPPGVPQPRDKRIPGRYDPGHPNAPGLHRITEKLEPGQYKANRDHKDGACYGKGPYRDEYADTGLPADERPQPPAYQCDEYPFASTLEGAGNPYWDFSVKAVPRQENGAAGILLKGYYVDDRILVWDSSLPNPEANNDRFFV